jgi:isoamylase
MIYSNHMTSPQPGRSFPLGSSHLNGAVNFSVYSRSATAMELLLFDDAEAERPDRVITLDPTINRSFHYWHVAIPGIGDGQIYAWRADGPFDPAHGHRFDPDKVLLDPYGRAVVVPEGFSRTAAYDWEGDEPLRGVLQDRDLRAARGGFTRHPSSGVADAAAPSRA